jgi:hypothetical protein
VVLAPPVVFAAVTGQTSLLIGAAMLCGLWRLHRPWLAGALLGAALCVKPQLLFLLPFGLAATRAWRPLATTVLAAAALCLASVAAFGLDAWRDWLAVLPLHRAWEARMHLKSVSLAPDAGLPARIALVAIGGAVVAWLFRRGDLITRQTGLAAVSMLCAPHAMPYDLAVVAPCALALMGELNVLSLAGLGLFVGAVAAPATLAGYVALSAPPLSTVLRNLSRPRTVMLASGAVEPFQG